jgi:osmotically inducible lipoprotein OsmB
MACYIEPEQFIRRQVMSKLPLFLAGASLALLAGCLSPDGERAAAGAAIGGLGAALLDGNVVAGAAVGAAAGALCDDAGVCRR